MIETDRLIIREYIEDDFDDFWEIFSNQKVTRSYGLAAFEYKRDAFRFFEGRLKKPFDFAIILKPNMKLIGEISLGDPVNRSVFQFPYTKEMGVIANEKYQKKGYMTEGAKAIIKHCFDEEGLNGIYCRAYSYNIPSIKFSKKCGMRVLSKSMESLVYSKPTEIVTSGITKEEYRSSKIYEGLYMNFIQGLSDDMIYKEVVKKSRIERQIEREIYDNMLFETRVKEIQSLLDADPNKKQLISLDKSF